MNPVWFAAGALLAVAFLSAASAQAEYLAYAVDEGSRRPLPESIDAIDAHDLLEVQWKYRGGRSPVLVLPVTGAGGRRSASGSEAGYTGGAMPGEGAPLSAIHNVVMEAMRQTGRFEVEGNASGAARRDAVPSDGHTLLVTVATYENDVRTRISNPRALRSGPPQVETGRVVLRMRLVGANGNVVLMDRFEAVVAEPRPDFADYGTVKESGFDILRTSIGQATLAAVNKGVYEIVKAVGRLPVSGRVVKAEDDRAWVNLGAGALEVGDVLEVTAQGETLIDPETGLDLGGVETTLATLRVVRVEERFSIAEVLSATQTPDRGDRVRSAPVPTGFAFGPAWETSASTR